MKKLLFVVLLLAMVVSIGSARERYDRKITITQEILATDSTAYALSVSTKVISIITARLGRQPGAYLVNLSTICIIVTTVDYGTGASANTEVRTNGFVVCGAENPLDDDYEGYTTYSDEKTNTFFLKTGEAYYIVSGGAAAVVNTGKVRVFDVWVDPSPAE